MALRITIHGSYGTGNRGDNSILFQLLRFLEREAPDAEVTILCRDTERLRLQLAPGFGVSSLRLHLLHYSFKRHPVAVLKACTACDLFILGGGGLLFGTASGNLGYWLQRPRLALLFRRKLAIYAPGIYAIKGARAQKLLAKVARKAHFLSVRDPEGLATLMAAGVPKENIFLGADPAFLLPPYEAERGKALGEALGIPQARWVGISARDWRGRLSAGLFARFVVRLLQDPEVLVIFFPFKTGGLLTDTDRNDAEVGRHLMLTLPEELHSRIVLLGDDLESEDYVHLMGRCEFVIGMRLHSLIFATLSGTPFGALPYDRKIEAYMEMLGRSEMLVHPEDFSLADRQERLIRQLREERGGGDAPVASILAAGTELAGRARALHVELAHRLHEWFPGRAGGPSHD